MSTEESAKRVWDNAGLLKGSVVEVYFGWRCVAVPTTGNLRFAPSLKHTSGASYPAIISRAENANGEMTGIQRTFLAPDGAGKAPVPKKQQKMSLGVIKGSMVRLAEPRDGAPLILGEGVESVQTVLQATGYPGAATLGTAGLSAASLSDNEKDVILLGENDDGKNAAAIAKVAPDLKKKGIRVRVAYPPAGFKDFNDMVMGAADRTAAFAAVRKAIEDAEDWVDLPGDGGKSEKAPTQAAMLVSLATAHCDELFHDENREAYAICHAPHDGGVHREVHRLKSKSFKESLLLTYFDTTNGVPNDSSIRSAIAVLGAIARFRGEQREVFVRRAFFKGNLYVDLCNDRWQAVQVDASDWRVVDEPPVLFIRAPGMLALPDPKRCDPKRGIALLKAQMRARTVGDFVIIVAFMLDALGGRGPHALLFFKGESGSTKTTHAKMVRALTDPNSRPVRSKPKELRDVYIAAIKSGIVVYNNLSSLPDWLSDVLCVITEGSSESRRELFTDDDESVIFARAPVILAAVNNIVTQGDLGARTLYAGLAPVPDSERKTEPELWKEFNEAAPEILGALLTGLSVGLRRLPTIKTTLPRMATFAQFAMACETTFWPEGTFAAAYEVNALNAVAEALDENLAVSTFRDFMEEVPDGKWKGTATQLYAALTERIRKPERDAVEAHEKAVAARDPDLQVLTQAKLREARQSVRDVMNSGWPKKPDLLTRELRKSGPQLRKIGIAITWPTNNRDRSILVETHNSPDLASQPFHASQTSAHDNENNDLNGKPPGSQQPLREATFDPDSEIADENGNAGEPPGSEGWEATLEELEATGKPLGHTEYADNQLNKQVNATGREAWESGEAKRGHSATRPASESMHAPPIEPETQKEPTKPPKRTVPL
jgi:Toprim domain